MGHTCRAAFPPPSLHPTMCCVNEIPQTHSHQLGAGASLEGCPGGGNQQPMKGTEKATNLVSLGVCRRAGAARSDGLFKEATDNRAIRRKVGPQVIPERGCLFSTMLLCQRRIMPTALRGCKHIQIF